LLFVAVGVVAWQVGLLLLGSRDGLPVGISVVHFPFLHVPCDLQMDSCRNLHDLLVCLFRLRVGTPHLMRDPVPVGNRLR
jgi:hypothetical protein